MGEGRSAGEGDVRIVANAARACVEVEGGTWVEGKSASKVEGSGADGLIQTQLACTSRQSQVVEGDATGHAGTVEVVEGTTVQREAGAGGKTVG